jgi:hypothetical protein
MIKVKIPNNNLNERKYILDIIFNEFLGLEYFLEIGSKNYEIELKNKKIIIKDTFFNKYPKDLEYLYLENIPNKIEGLDIFAASFFMLTRWEEYVNKNRDSHNRFPATESLAYKQGFLDRPIVNEYVETLKGMLLKVDERIVFKKKDYQFFLTHDVDIPFKFYSLKGSIKTLAGDLLRRKNINKFIKNLRLFIDSRFDYKKDPFNTFNFIFDINNKYEINSYFFFMGTGVTKYDNAYAIKNYKTRQLIKEVKRNNNKIGLHSSYASYEDSRQFQKEKKEVESVVGSSMTCGRQHYLNFSVPKTWQNYEDASLLYDSTMGYADLPGFRSGVCYEYSVFNILTRKKLHLIEKPLIVMECTIFEERYMNLQADKSYEEIIKYIDIIKKYRGEFTLLWHNNRLENKWQRELYIKVLSYAK